MNDSSADNVHNKIQSNLSIEEYYNLDHVTEGHI